MNVLAAATEVIHDAFDLDLEVYHVDTNRVVVDARELAKDVSRAILSDLAERLEKAAKELAQMARTARWEIADEPAQDIRLAGKADGVNLALSYLKEYQ